MPRPNCLKCQGYLVTEYCYEKGSGTWCHSISCVNCGAKYDRQNEANKANRPAAPRLSAPFHYPVPVSA